jgi:hypothetical protein
MNRTQLHLQVLADPPSWLAQVCSQLAELPGLLLIHTSTPIEGPGWPDRNLEAVVKDYITTLLTFIEIQRESIPHGREERTPGQDEHLPDMIRRGKRCLEIQREISRFRHMCLDGVRTAAEVKLANPTWAVWGMVENLSAEDRETFAHPNRWGPVVGYSLRLLGKEYSKSAATIRNLD